MKSVKKWHDYKVFLMGGVAGECKLFISGHV